jgi:hypothetical protein
MGKRTPQPVKQIMLALLAALVLGSCSPDPRRAAEAFATESDAKQRAADAEQRRQQEAEEHEIAMQNSQATQAQKQTFINKLLAFSAPFAQATVMLWILGMGVGGVYALLETTRAYSKYANRRAVVLANQIPLDPHTHTYPLLTVELSNNIIALVNPNDNSVLLLDKHNSADRAKVQAMANVLVAGQVAHHARLSHKPGDVATIAERASVQIIDSEVKA